MKASRRDFDTWLDIEEHRYTIIKTCEILHDGSNTILIIKNSFDTTILDVVDTKIMIGQIYSIGRIDMRIKLKIKMPADPKESEEHLKTLFNILLHIKTTNPEVDQIEVAFDISNYDDNGNFVEDKSPVTQVQIWVKPRC